MSPFYQKLNKFGTLVTRASYTKNMDMANYFTVMHPAHPVIADNDVTRPAIRFEAKCPREVKREVATLWKIVFGR